MSKLLIVILTIALIVNCLVMVRANGFYLDAVMPTDGNAIDWPFTHDDVEIISRMVYGEARGLPDDEQALCVWVVLQRLMHDDFPDTIADVVTQPGQFCGYNPEHPVTDEIYTLVLDELMKWAEDGEPPTHSIYCPETPYYYFAERIGEDGKRHNYYRAVF